MKKDTNTQKEPKKQRPPGEARSEGTEIYLAPPPLSKGRVIGLDCHPDTFTAAVFRGTTPHDARKLSTHPDMSLKKLLDWAAKEFTRDDLFLMEASSNSFELHRRLLALGLRAVVMESCHVGKHAKTYADNDKMAAARIALVYFQGNVPCVWVPDPVIIGDVRRFERPEKLVAYIGLNPGQRESGRGKHIKLGVGKRGRGDMRRLLVQGAHAVLRTGKNTPLGKWGWKLFARKGQRNIAVTAVARKLLVQVWHLLSGNPPEALEPGKSLTTKFKKLAVMLGKDLRALLSLPSNVEACVAHLQSLITAPCPGGPAACNQP